MFDNVSNDINTNIFEATPGVLNVAPIKMSGRYKIVVSNDGNTLYLDDYNMRRVVVDKSQPFLPQVANFLSTQSSPPNVDRLKYGGFSTGKQLSYHIPLYITNKDEKNGVILPEYFVLNRVTNSTDLQPHHLYSNSTVVKLESLERVGLRRIFDEVLEMFTYPINFNWDDNTVTIYGYSLADLCRVEHTFSVANNQSNQPYIEVFNNQLMNKFGMNGMFFPKFINIEFEFSFDTTNFEFNNFFGFLSNALPINTIEDFVGNNGANEIITDLETYNDGRVLYSQTRTFVEPHPYLDLLYSAPISNVANRIPQVRFKTNNVQPGDTIFIKHPSGTTVFSYTIRVQDIKDTLLSTMLTVCSKMSSASNLDFVFDYNVTTRIITCRANLVDLYIEEFTIHLPVNFSLVDGQDFFIGITDNDVLFGGSNYVDLNTIKIGNNTYGITKKYRFNNMTLFRLSQNPFIQVTEIGQFYQTKLSRLIKHKPINLYSVNADLKARLQYENEKYIEELKLRFIDNRTDTDDSRYEEYLEASEEAIDRYSAESNILDKFPYVKDIIFDEVTGSKVTVSSDTVQQNYHNGESILNMMFNSPGCTAFITPNILNMEKKFYENNALLNYVLVDEDKLKFHWFLIKSECPDYIKNDIRSLRYFTDTPKITSRLTKYYDSTFGYCETVFLGVKYRLPYQFDGYQFAVYLNFKDERFVDTLYDFEVSHTNKTIYLCINKFYDFIDLLQGGNDENEKFLDLAFFYNVQSSHNTLSEALYSFNSGGILICDDEIPVFFENINTNDWKIFDDSTGKWYICLKRSISVITDVFTDIFPTEGDIEFYIYSSVTIGGHVYNYVSMKFTAVNIRFVSTDFVWCEDLKVEFYDTNNFFINMNNTEFINVPVENILSIVPNAAPPVYDGYTAQATILVDAAYQVFKIINPVDEFSLKKYYFEMTRKIFYPENTNVPTVTMEGFVFPEYFQGPQDFDSLDATFGQTGTSFDDTTFFAKISIFERNQLWNLIRNILNINVRFKHTTVRQTQRLINKLLVNNLVEFSNLYFLPIRNSQEKIKLSVIKPDINLVIWKHYLETGSVVPEDKVSSISRYRSPYMPYLRKLSNELEFQADRLSMRSDVLHNIFDKNFAGPGINATGLWNEVTGNVLSSLFTMTRDISITIDFVEEINYRNLLRDSLTLEDMIIRDKNVNYIGGIDANIDEYIRESYVDWFLNGFYKLEAIKNELGQSLNYTNIGSYQVKLNPLMSYNTLFSKLIFVFKRK